MVIGGSIAGLLAARALTAHAARVTVVERDRFPDGGQPRPGVPQGRHPHVLLEGGQQALDALLPGFTAELRAAGAPRVGMPSDMMQWQDGRWFRRLPASTHLFTGSRSQLDQLVRARVLADPAVSVLQGTQVVGLSGDATRVRGVLLRERGETGSGPRHLAADLVVDASGRGTKAAQWLTEIGAEAAYEECIDAGFAYATRAYHAPLGPLGPRALGYYVVASPAQPYAGLALPLEDGRYLVALAGVRGDHPPTDGDGFETYAKKLPHPYLHRWLSAAEPASQIHGFAHTANVRRRYDLPGRRPAGFLAIGDALCTFNPIYGQGMAVAAMSAVALRTALADRRHTPTTRRVQRILLAASRQAWDISAGADKGMPGATGNALGTSALERPAVWYLRRVQARYPGDPVVGRAFRSVVALTAPVSALFAPRVARAVLFGPVRPTPVDLPLEREETPDETPPADSATTPTA